MPFIFFSSNQHADGCFCPLHLLRAALPSCLVSTSCFQVGQQYFYTLFSIAFVYLSPWYWKTSRTIGKAQAGVPPVTPCRIVLQWTIVPCSCFVSWDTASQRLITLFLFRGRKKQSMILCFSKARSKLSCFSFPASHFWNNPYFCAFILFTLREISAFAFCAFHFEWNPCLCFLTSTD